MLGRLLSLLLSALKWYACFYGFYLTLPHQQRLLQPLLCSLVTCSWPEPCTASGGVVSNVSSGLKVVLPSVGQTGTTSVHAALLEMGYRAYHIEERLPYAPLMLDGLQPEDFARGLSRCAVDSLSLEPNVDILPAVLAVSPDAKVILSWRAYPEWKVSTESGGMIKDLVWKHFQFLVTVPYHALHAAFLLDAMSGALSRELRSGRPFTGVGQAGPSTFLLRIGIGNQYDTPGTDTYGRGVFKVFGQEEAYLAHMDEIRRLAAGRLLEFNVKRHGYPELAEFLGRPAPEGSPPFPHPRSKDSWTNDVLVIRNQAAHLVVMVYYVLFDVTGILIWHAAVRGLLRLLCRRRRRTTTKKAA